MKIKSAVRSSAIRHAILETLENRQHLSAQISIRFAPSGTAAVAGFITDSGGSYKTQYDRSNFGWDKSNATATFKRAVAGVSALKNTAINVGARKWEIELPNGSYKVHLVAGDAADSDNKYQINVEGNKNFLVGTATSTRHFIEATSTVTISDGKLTLTGVNGADNPISYIEITPIGSGPLPYPDFVSALPVPGGFLLDWEDASNYEDGYTIYRRVNNPISPTSYTQIARLVPNAEAYFDNTATAGVDYTYRIIATAGAVKAINSFDVEARANKDSSRLATASGDPAHEIYNTIPLYYPDYNATQFYAYDLTTGNAGGHMVNGNQDVYYNSSEGGVLSWTRKGEWLEYTINFPSTSQYRFDTNVASKGIGGTFRYVVDGTTATKSVQIPDTGSFSSFQQVASSSITISKGLHVIRLEMVSDGSSTWVGNFTNVGVVRTTQYTVQRNDPYYFPPFDYTEGDEVNVGIGREYDSGEITSAKFFWGDGKSDAALTNPGSIEGYQWFQRHTYSPRASAIVTASVVSGGKTYQADPLELVFKPKSPTELKASLTKSNTIQFKWVDNSKIETGYLLAMEYVDDSSNTIRTEKKLPANSTSFAWDKLTSGRRYVFSVSALNNGISSDPASTPKIVPPKLDKTVTDLTITSIDYYSISFTFTDLYNGLCGYIVQRNADNQGWTEIGRIVPDDIPYYSGPDYSYTNDVELDHRYEYRVIPFSELGQGPVSNTDLAYSHPRQAESLQISSVITTSFILSWTDLNKYETGYTVMVYEKWSDQPAREINLAANTNKYTITGLKSYTEYQAWVVTTNPTSTVDTSSQETKTLAKGTVPAQPANLWVARISGSQIDIKWKDGTAESKYEIYRAIEFPYNGYTDLKLIGTVGANITKYSDKALTAETNYHYFVKALNSFGENEGLADAGTATSTLKAAKLNSAKPLDSGQVMIQFTNEVLNATDQTLRIFRTINGVQTNVDVEYFLGADGYFVGQNDGLIEGVQYGFQLINHGYGGYSVGSNILYATPMAHKLIVEAPSSVESGSPTNFILTNRNLTKPFKIHVNWDNWGEETEIINPNFDSNGKMTITHTFNDPWQSAYYVSIYAVYEDGSVAGGGFNDVIFTY